MLKCWFHLAPSAGDCCHPRWIPLFLVLNALLAAIRIDDYASLWGLQADSLVELVADIVFLVFQLFPRFTQILLVMLFWSHSGRLGGTSSLGAGFFLRRLVQCMYLYPGVSVSLIPFLKFLFWVSIPFLKFSWFMQPVYWLTRQAEELKIYIRATPVIFFFLEYIFYLWTTIYFVLCTLNYYVWDIALTHKLSILNTLHPLFILASN